MTADTSPRTGVGRTLLTVALVFVAVIALILALLWFWPLGIDYAAPSSGNAGATFADAMGAVSAAVQEAGGEVNPLCHTRAVTSGAASDHVVVIFHGLGSCPQQFADFAQMLLGRGANVLLVRLPYHGMADRLADAPANSSAEQALAEAGHWIGVAHGLGEKVTVLGFSGGAGIAAHLAQTRGDIDRAVIVAPLVGVQALPAAGTRPISTLARFVPNWWGWFNPDLKEKVEGPTYTYPRYASRALAEFLRIGLKDVELPGAQPPATTDIRVVLNGSDEVVRNEMARSLVEGWQANGVDVRVYEFPADIGLKHDMIDPGQPYQQVGAVYPVLLEAVTADEPDWPTQ